MVFVRNSLEGEIRQLQKQLDGAKDRYDKDMKGVKHNLLKFTEDEVGRMKSDYEAER